MGTDLQFSFVFIDEEIGAVTALLEEADAASISQVEQRGMTGVELIIFAVLATRAASEIISKLSRMWKCGVIVDTRGTRVVTEKNCDLPRGDVMIISTDQDRVTLHEPAKSDIESLLRTLPGASSA